MYMADAIVFTQSELCAALGSGARSIILCDNNFHLPSNQDIEYTAIGQVKASADFSDPDALGISCVNFVPKLKKRPKTVHISNKAVGVSSLNKGSYSGSYSSSYGGSYAGSYRLGSFFSSYRLSLKSSFSTSYSTSYNTSYITSYRYEYKYRTSFSGSFATSYRLAQSFKTGASSFKLSSFVSVFKRRSYDRILKEISVNGYGIHLI